MAHEPERRADLDPDLERQPARVELATRGNLPPVRPRIKRIYGRTPPRPGKRTVVPTAATVCVLAAVMVLMSSCGTH